jgi:alpha-1,6-mannosyltransferase
VKICDLTQFYSPVSGGVKRYITEKRRYLAEHTQDEHYLIVPGETTRHTVDGRLHTLTVQSPRLDRTSRYRLMLNTRLVRDWLDDIRPDVIESGDPYHLAWSAIRSGRELHIPVFAFYHSHFPEAYLRTILKYGGSWLRDAAMAYAQDYIVWLYRQFHSTLVASPHLRNLLADWGVDNAVTLKLGVDTGVFQPGPMDTALRAELGIPGDAFVLLYVGRLSSEKNIEVLLEAFRRLRASRKENFHLVLLGDGPLRRLLPAVRRETGALTWHSYLNDNTALARYYRMANLFVHPGVCETFGLVVLEAQSCGCPAAGIHGSYMDANVFAGLDYWARENSPSALAQTILTMSRLDLPALGRKAAPQVRENFTWKRVFSELWGHYTAAASCTGFQHVPHQLTTPRWHPEPALK